MPSNNVISHLGDMTIEVFLSEYWQKKPVFIPGALSGYSDSLTPEKLIAISCRHEVESRLVIETPYENPLKSDWKLEYGPLTAKHFKDLPQSHWSLLVNAVDHIEPELHQFIHRFRFMPNWRLDDVMVSYASEQGSIGPHFDHYDVFLFQAAGERRWRIGQSCDEDSLLRTDTEMKILDQFIQQEEYLCKPGDLLYIPPKVAHWGIANKESITYSVGFIAPSHSDVILDITQDLGANISSNLRFSDTYRKPSDNPGEISCEDINQLKDILQQHLNDEDLLARYFGEMITAPRRQSSDSTRPVSNSGPWKLAAHVRSSYYLTKQKHCLLFIDGLSWECSHSLAKTICHYQAINKSDFNAHHSDLFDFLLSEGKLYEG